MALLANHAVLVVAADIRQAWHIEAAGGGHPIAAAEANRLGAMIDGNGFPFLWEAMARRQNRKDASVLSEQP